MICIYYTICLFVIFYLAGKALFWKGGKLHLLLCDTIIVFMNSLIYHGSKYRRHSQHGKQMGKIDCVTYHNGYLYCIISIVIIFDKKSRFIVRICSYLNRISILVTYRRYWNKYKWQFGEKQRLISDRLKRFDRIHTFWFGLFIKIQLVMLHGHQCRTCNLQLRLLVMGDTQKGHKNKY